MHIKKIVTLCCGLLIGLSMFAQILVPSQWTYKVSKEDMWLGDEINLVFSVELNDSWYLYSNVQTYKSGPLPTVFEFEPNNGYKLIGEVIPVNPKRAYDDVFEVDINYFENIAEFRQKVKILSNETVIRGRYSYQLCTTLDGKCIFRDDEFEFKIGPNVKK